MPKRSFFGSIWFGLPTFLLALAGCIMAAMSLFRSPPSMGRGISAYNFGSPEEAVKSLWQIEANHDLRAKREAEHLFEDPREVIKSLEVKETLNATAKNLKVVLFSYKRNGKEKRDYWAFVKHPTSDVWLRRYVFDFDLEAAHPDIARRMREWRSREFDPFYAD